MLHALLPSVLLCALAFDRLHWDGLIEPSIDFTTAIITEVLTSWLLSIGWTYFNLLHTTLSPPLVDSIGIASSPQYRMCAHIWAY